MVWNLEQDPPCGILDYHWKPFVFWISSLRALSFNIFQTKNLQNMYYTFPSSGGLLTGVGTNIVKRLITHLLG